MRSTDGEKNEGKSPAQCETERSIMWNKKRMEKKV